MELHRELATANDEDSDDRYHRVKMSFQPELRGAQIDLTYDDSPHVWRWLYNTDAYFWDLTNIIEVPDPEDNGVLQGGNSVAMGDGGITSRGPVFLKRDLLDRRGRTVILS